MEGISIEDINECEQLRKFIVKKNSIIGRISNPDSFAIFLRDYGFKGGIPHKRLDNIFCFVFNISDSKIRNGQVFILINEKTKANVMLFKDIDNNKKKYLTFKGYQRYNIIEEDYSKELDDWVKMFLKAATYPRSYKAWKAFNAIEKAAEKANNEADDSKLKAKEAVEKKKKAYKEANDAVRKANKAKEETKQAKEAAKEADDDDAATDALEAAKDASEAENDARNALKAVEEAKEAERKAKNNLMQTKKKIFVHIKIFRRKFLNKMNNIRNRLKLNEAENEYKRKETEVYNARYEVNEFKRIAEEAYDEERETAAAAAEAKAKHKEAYDVFYEFNKEAKDTLGFFGYGNRSRRLAELKKKKKIVEQSFKTARQAVKEALEAAKDASKAAKDASEANQLLETTIKAAQEAKIKFTKLYERYNKLYAKENTKFREKIKEIEYWFFLEEAKTVAKKKEEALIKAKAEKEKKEEEREEKKK